MFSGRYVTLYVANFGVLSSLQNVFLHRHLSFWKRWQSFSHEKSQSVSAFLATFDKEKSFYESATNRTLEEVDLVARLLDAVDPTLALKLQESHDSNRHSSGRKQSEKASSKKDGPKQKNSEQSTDFSAKKVIPR
ncbi:hypothetical protein FOL46_004079, partial [Perkinsus olseni]